MSEMGDLSFDTRTTTKIHLCANARAELQSINSLQMTPTGSGSGVLPSARQSVDSILDAPAPGSSGLQISLDLGEIDLDVGDGGPDEDEWEDVEQGPPPSASKSRQARSPAQDDLERHCRPMKTASRCKLQALRVRWLSWSYPPVQNCFDAGAVLLLNLP